MRPFTPPSRPVGSAARGLSAAAIALAIGSLIGITGCAGVEGDVLSLRREPPGRDLGPSPDLAEPSEPPRCAKQKLSARVCTDLSDWKLQADGLCRMLGQSLLGGFEPQGLCMAGMTQGAMGVLFECCKPLPSPPPLQCTGRVQGDLTSCKEAGIWQMSAAIDCGARNESVEALTLVDVCGPSRFRFARYQCCAPLNEPNRGVLRTPGQPPGDTRNHETGPGRAALTEGP